jgi:hypothetical protein
MTTIDNPVADLHAVKHAVRDDTHIGHINGAIADIAPRLGWVFGPGLIVMAGDDDAGALGTYPQADQNYGTTLMWTLMLLIPVLYVNREMVVRLGVTGGGDARLIRERFGRFWGAFSVVDLVLLNAGPAPRLKDDPSVKWWKWRMAPLHKRPPARLTPLNRITMIVLRAHLVVAAGLVLLRIVRLATAGASSRFAHLQAEVSGGRLCTEWDCWGPRLQARAAAAQ